MKVWWRSFFWIVAINIGIIGCAWSWGDRVGLVWGFLVALSINYYLVLYSPVKRLAKGAYSPIFGNDSWDLNSTALSVARRLKIPPPQIVTWESDLAQCFVLCKWPIPKETYGVVGISSQALKDFNSEEREMLLAWSIVALKSGRVINWTYLGLFLNLLLIVLSSLDRILGWMLTRKLNHPHGITLWIAAPLIALIQRGFSSTKDYDQIDNQLRKMFPEHLTLADVFKKMHFQNQTRPSEQNLAFSHLFYSPLISRQGALSFLRLQPGYKKRIQKLCGHYPL